MHVNAVDARWMRERGDTAKNVGKRSEKRKRMPCAGT